MFLLHSSDIHALDARDFEMFEVLTVDAPAGLTVDLSALAGAPFKSITFLAINGLVMMPGIDYTPIADVNGHYTGYVLDIPSYIGDAIAIKAQSKIDLQSQDS